MSYELHITHREFQLMSLLNGLIRLKIRAKPCPNEPLSDDLWNADY